MIDSSRYDQYISILKEELMPAMGCTEPISIAYISACVKKALGCLPESVEAVLSGNIIKNVKSVIVPNTGGMRGIAVAVAAGMVAGRADKMLEVIAGVGEDRFAEIRDFAERVPVHVTYADESKGVFYIEIIARAGEHTARGIIKDTHTNVVCVERDGVDLGVGHGKTACEGKETDRSVLTVEGIVEFADMLRIEDVEEILSRQIEANMAIAEEGLRHKYGANIGKVILSCAAEGDLNARAKAYAAAGSDARMNGCDMPVVINSGSGNQGLTCSVPVIVFARAMNADKDTLYRALAVSNLVTIHLKAGIGTLSAYCGAVSAGAGCGAGIAYLKGGRFKQIAHTIVNAIAVDSGIICDGAKASCAAKIASAVEAGLLGLEMYEQGNQFFGGDGIVSKGVENTIQNVSQLARIGMHETAQEIIDIMLSGQQKNCM